MRIIGVDIGTYSIKIAEIVSGSKSYRVRDFFEILLNPDPTQDRRIEMIESLRKVATHYHSDDCRFVVAVANKVASQRNVTFPFKERHKILRSVPFELEDEVPFESDDSIFEAKILRTFSKGSQVLATIVPKENIKDLLNLCDDSGIEPDIVSISTLALANNFEDWRKPPPVFPDPEVNEDGDPVEIDPVNYPPAQLLLDIGHTSTNLLVFSEGTLLTTRSYNFGGHDIVESLRRKYGITYLEAAKALREKGFVLTSKEGASKEQLQFAEVISHCFERLCSDVKVSLIELKTDLKVNFEKMGLTGGVSRLMNICPFLTTKLEVSVNLTEHLKNHDIEIPNTPETARISGIAIGLAIEALRRPRNPAANLRKLEFLKQSQSMDLFWKKWKHGIQVSLALYFAFCVYAFFRESYAISASDAAQEALSKQAKANSLKGNEATQSGVKKFITAKKKEILDKQNLSQLIYINSTLDVMAHLSQRFPPKSSGLEVRRLAISSENMIIEGEGDDNSIATLKKTLQGISTNNQVTESSPTISAPSGKKTFAFNLKVQRKFPGSGG